MTRPTKRPVDQNAPPKQRSRARSRQPDSPSIPVNGMRPQRRMLDVPEDVRTGQRAYNTAIRNGDVPTAEERTAHTRYERLRWAQLPELQRGKETAASNEARRVRERVYGRPPTTLSAMPAYRAKVRLIKRHYKEFTRLLEAEEALANE